MERENTLTQILIYNSLIIILALCIYHFVAPHFEASSLNSRYLMWKSSEWADAQFNFDYMEVVSAIVIFFAGVIGYCINYKSTQRVQFIATAIWVTVAVITLYYCLQGYQIINYQWDIRGEEFGELVRLSPTGVLSCAMAYALPILIAVVAALHLLINSKSELTDNSIPAMILLGCAFPAAWILNLITYLFCYKGTVTCL